MTIQLRWARVSAICGLASAVSSIAAPVLDLDTRSLTEVLYTSPSAAQDLRPRFDQRAVEIDGSLRSGTPMGLAIAADSIGGGYPGQRRLADIALDTGSYAPTAIDLALPCRGVPVVIGRTYNSVQHTGSSRYNSNGLQGFNWAQTGLPEIAFHDADSNPATKGADDAVYLLLGADRSIEFHRVMASGAPTDTFKAKNGAAGVIVVNNPDDPDYETYEYIDQRGNRVEFFGIRLSNTDIRGQLWRMRAPKDGGDDWIAYGGDPEDSYDASKSSDFGVLRPNTFFDASGRRYSFTYATYGGVDRLTQVVAAELNGSTWDTVAQVDYDYYDGVSNTDDGLAGDLRMATVTIFGTGTNNHVARTYYRYMVGTGYEHLVRLVVGPEGVRQFGVAGLDAASDATLTSYSSLLVNSYDANGRITNATLNGDCGCSGGTSGVYGLSYDTVGSYSTYITNAAYDDAWAKRTIVDQPDSAYKVHYFDETGAALAVVTADGDPTGGSPPNFWVSSADRDSSGRVTSILSPAAVSGYTHSSGVITPDSSAGLVTIYTRTSGGDLDGLRTGISVQEGTGTSPILVSSATLNSVVLSIGASEVRAPFVATSTSYPSGGGGDTTTYSRTYWSTTAGDSRCLALESMQVAAPAVSTSHNGSGSATSTYRYFRHDGTMAFSMDADGTISYTGLDAYGLPVVRIADVDTSGSGFVGGDDPTDWTLTSSGSPYHIASAMGYDAQGRLIETVTYAVGGSTRSARMVYETLSDGTLAVFSFPRYASSMYYGPGKLKISNLAGKPLWSASLGISSGGTATVPGTVRDATWSNAVQNVYDNTGSRLVTSKLYVEDYPSTGTDDTTYTYDSMGRIATVTDATGTISRTTYDAIGRAIERSIGTDDSGTGSDNMTVVEKMEYDGGAASGNSHLTKIKRDSDGNWATTGDQRITEHKYDFRGRAIVTLNPMAPHTLTKYDNVNRVLASGQYTSNTIAITDDPTSVATARVALSQTSYDERGMVYRTTRHEVNPSTGALGGNLTSDTWYDADGRTIKQIGSQITKTEYDRLGRGVASWIISSVDDATYADAFGVSGDIVLEETRNGLDADTGATLARAHVMRVANGSVGGALASTSGLTISPTSIAGRASITAMWYDELDRVVDTVDYGTNESAGNFDTFDRAAATTPPARDPNANRRTTYTYDDFGRSNTVTDARGIVQKTQYDVAGRTSVTIANYVDGTPGPSPGDAVVETKYTAGLVTETIRYLASGYETTIYSYGTTKGTTSGQSAIASNRLLTTTTLDEQYISQPSTDRQQKVAYNALGEVIWSKDPAGNEIISEYDLAGRVIARVADVVISGFDNRVRRIEYEYDSRGHLVEARQRDGKTTSGTILDETQMQYNGWGMVDQSAMDPDSTLGGSGRDAFVTTSTYAINSGTGIAKTLRLTGRTQPGGVSVAYVYASGIDSNISRPSSLEDQWSTPIAEYGYMGVGTVLDIKNPEPDVWAVSSIGSGDLDYLDRFNRPIRNVTYANAAGPTKATLDLEMVYVNHGEALCVKDNALTDGSNRVFDTVTAFDELRRATSRKEGEMGLDMYGDYTILAAGRRFQDFGRDLLGRTTSDKLDLDANGSGIDGPPDATEWGEMEDTRTFNKRNELVSRSVKDSTNPSSPRTVNLTYDLNGNLTSDGEKFDYVYNPWGQLVEIKKIGGSTTAAKYTYSAMGHRISEQLDTNDSSNSGVGDGVVDAYDPVFFIATDPVGGGRRLATYRGTDYDPKETFIHHDARIRGPVHQGGPILRDRNADLADKPFYWASEPADTDRYERHYYALDYRGYVSAIFTSDGKLVEQVRYSATGVPFNIPLGDVNADGKVEAGSGSDPDYFDINDMITYPAKYHVRGDLDLDGDVDAADLAIAQARDGTATGRGYLTMVGADHRISIWYAEYISRHGFAENLVDSSFLVVTLDILTAVEINAVATDDEGSGTPVKIESGCCDKVRKKLTPAQQESVSGFIACCNGTATICVYDPSDASSNCDSAGSCRKDGCQRANEAVKACTRIHEQNHMNDIEPCDPTKEAEISVFRQGVSRDDSECRAYRAGLECIKNKSEEVCDKILLELNPPLDPKDRRLNASSPPGLNRTQRCAVENWKRCKIIIAEAIRNDKAQIDKFCPSDRRAPEVSNAR